MSHKRIEIKETDEAERVIATYVQTPGGQDGTSRIDVVQPEGAKSIWERGLDVFLPTGYPHSVTKDYMEYQIYSAKDSLQAFSSSIAGLLSSRAVLSSVGVGDASASPTAALLLSIFQESTGRLATILFAHRFGTAFEPECKLYRLLADILNDIAFVLDCLSPVFPKPVRVVVLSLSSILRALCGVAAGSAKASLSAHFAKWGNLGELNAKDSSQETVISLLGMLAGTFVVSWITTPMATWTALILLLSIHLETNRRAVRAVIMKTLNRQRATLVFHRLVQNAVPTPETISKEEFIFERGGILRDSRGRAVGRCSIGASFSQLLRALAAPHTKTRSSQVPDDVLKGLLDLYQDRPFLLWYTGDNKNIEVIVVIKKSALPRDLLLAWWQAVALVNTAAASNGALAKSEQKGERSGLDEQKLEMIAKSMKVAEALMGEHESGLTASGWDLATGALETSSSTRVLVE